MAMLYEFREFDDVFGPREFSDRYGRHSHHGNDVATDVFKFIGHGGISGLRIELDYIGRHRELMDTWYRNIHKSSDGAMVRILDVSQ